jgi:hypothetical protein
MGGVEAWAAWRRGRSGGRPALLALVRLPCVLALVGGLGLVAAFFMPWFGTQGLLLSGAFLNQFLSSTPDLRRFVPGASGGVQEAQMLRGLVDLFPACGALGAVVALVAGLRSTASRGWGVGMAVLGGVPLVALLIGLARLPAGSTFEVGLWTIGLGAACLCLGGLLEAIGTGRKTSARSSG